MVVDYILSSTVHREALKYAKENNSCLGSLGNVASEVVCENRAPVGAGRSREIAKCLHISTSYLHCPPGDYQRTIPSQQDYRDKIEPGRILRSFSRDPFTKAQLVRHISKVLREGTEKEVVKVTARSSIF